MQVSKGGIVLGVLLAVGASPAARADLTRSVSDQRLASRVSTPVLSATLPAAPTVPQGVRDGSGDLGVSYWGDVRALSDAPAGSLTNASGLEFPPVVPAAPHREVVELPPAPSSTALFLSAMVSLGAWQLVRSSKDLHLGAMPEWYHTGGPAQVGHATAFDLDFARLPVCMFEEPIGEPLSFYHLRREPVAPGQPQSFLTAADSRGPPAQAC